MNLLQRLRIRRLSRHLVHQHDISDCGPSALLTALRVLGGNTSLETVRRLAGTDASGTSVFGLVSAAQQLGIDALAVKGQFEDLAKQNMPLLAHVTTVLGLGHFVVVLAADADGVHIADPAGRCSRLSRADFGEQWQSKVAILLARSEGRQLLSEPQPTVGQWLWHNLSVYGTWITQSIFTGCLYALLAIAAAVMLQVIVDRFIPTDGATLVIIGAAAFAVIGLLRAGMGYTRQYLGAQFMKTAGTLLAKEFIEQIFLREFNFFRTRRPKDISSRLNDLVSITNSLVWTLGEIIVDLLLVLAVTAMLTRVSGIVAAATLASLCMLAAILLKVMGGVTRDQRENVGAFVRAESIFLDAVTGISELKSFSLEKVHAGRVQTAFEKFMEINHRVRTKAAAVSIITESFSVCLLAGVLGYCALLVMRDQMLLGSLMETYALLGFALPSVAKLSQSLIAVQQARISADRLLESLGAEPESPGGGLSCSDPSELNVTGMQLNRPDGRALVHIAGFTIRRGELVVLQGANGSGKSTLAKALQLMIRPTLGGYSIDGLPAADYTLDSVRKHVVVIGKETHLFVGSLLENILQHIPENDRSDAMGRLERFGVTAVIAQMGLTATTQLGEGGRQLSSGENQVIGFARAIAGNPAFLVLDEAFGAIDSDRRAWAFNVIRAYAQEHGVLMIDHAWRDEIKPARTYRLADQNLVEVTCPTEAPPSQSEHSYA